MPRYRFLINAGLLSLILLIAGYMAVSLAVWSRQKSYIFMPQRELANTPADFGFEFEDLFIPVQPRNPDSERLHAWWIPADNDDGRTLLYLHGSAFNVAANIEHAGRFRRLGFSVLLVSYRGYGRSDGLFPSEADMYADARSAWRHLTVERGRPAEQLFIYGHSLGGAVAIDLALDQPRAAGLIVEGTFTSIPALGRLDPLYRLLPIDLIVNQRFDSLSKMGRARVPVLIIHGTDDHLVPVDMGRRLYTAANPPKILKLILGGGHNNSARIGGKIYLDAIADFAASVDPRSPSASRATGFNQRRFSRDL